MEASFRHFVQYDLEDHSSVSAITQSMIANEKLMREAAALLQACLSGLEIQETAIAVRIVSQESPLKQLFVATLVLTYQKELVEAVPNLWADLTGGNIPERYHTLFTVLVTIAAVYGISKAIDLLFPDKDKKELEASYNNLTYVAGDLLQLPSSQIDAVVKAKYKGQKPKQLFAAAKGFFAPVAGRKDAVIRGPNGVEITRAAIEEVPYQVVPDAVAVAEATASELYQGVKIVLHATDKDRGRLGWAGHIPGKFDDRVPMKIEKTIEPERLFGKTEIKGDVLVLYKVGPGGERIPAQMHLLSAGRR